MKSLYSEKLFVSPVYRGDEALKPFFHSDLRNTLEKVVSEKGTDKDKGALEKIFSDKTKTLKATVKALLEDIELREKLDSHLLQKVDDDICWQRTQILQLESQNNHYQFERFMEIKNQKMQLEGSVLELEKEKRKEYLECWRDLMFLKKYLLSAFREFWDLVKRREVLEEG